MTDETNDTGPRCAIEECIAGNTTGIAHCDLCGNQPCPRHPAERSEHDEPGHAPSRPKVVSLPLTGYAQTNTDVAAMLRGLADRIDAGEEGNVRHFVGLLEVIEGGVKHYVMGHGIDGFRLAGMYLHAANTALIP